MKTLQLNSTTMFQMTLLMLASSMKAFSGNELMYPQVKMDLTVIHSNHRINNAFIELLNKKTGIIEFYSTDANGNASVLMKPNSTYELQIGKDNLQSKKIKIALGDVSEPTTYSEVIELKNNKQ